jgi:hypothetical protein
MKKVFMILALSVLGVLILAGCQDEAKLSRITFAGTSDKMDIAYNSEFNVLAGVTATGDDGVDYTNQITYVTTATVSSTHMLDTQAVGAVAIKYVVTVGEFVAEKWRYLTVLNPEQVAGQMLINPDFSAGTGGWTDPAVNYVADGAAMEITAEDGALKVDVVAGSNVYTPRFGQMNVPFENGKTYEITFRAKSSVEKEINLQVGELLSGAPYFTDFKPGLAISKVITTEWATYSYKFTMNQAEENHRGGILFELGKFAGVQVDATLWFDDITIEEATADPDTTAPAFSGLIENKTIRLNTTYDAMAGVTAFDIVDGDVSEDITLVIKDGSQAVVTAIDTTVEGVYTLTYTVEDAAGNSAEFVVTLSIVSMQFSDTNLIVNGDFETALGDPAEWTTWGQVGWGVEAVYTAAIVDGAFQVDITNAGDQQDGWSVQALQLVDLEEGVTYRAQFDLKASVARDVNFVITSQTNSEFARTNGLALTTEWQTFDVVFTATKSELDVKFEFDLGNTAAYAAGIVSIDNVKLQEAMLDTLLVNTNMDSQGFYLWRQDWGGAAEVTYTENNAHILDIVSPGSDGAAWTIQFNQDGIALQNGKTYELKFDVSATVARDMNVKIFVPGSYLSYFEQLASPITTAVVSQTFEFTVTEADHAGLVLSFELGTTPAYAAGVVTLDNLSLKEKVAEAPEIIKNGQGNQVVGWVYDNAGGGEGSMTRVEGEAVVTVTALAAAYQPHVYQMLNGLVAGSYRLKVVVTSSVTRDLRINMVVPAWGYQSILEGTKEDVAVTANEEKVVYVDFVVANDITDQVKFEFDFGGLGEGFVSEAGVFTISEILLYQVFA